MPKSMQTWCINAKSTFWHPIPTSFSHYVATIETMSEVRERIKAKVYSCIAPSAARDGDMLSVRECLFSHALRGLPAAMQPLWLEAESCLWFCELQTRLVVGRSTFAIAPQEYTRNDLRRSKKHKNFPGGGGACTPLRALLEPPF